MFKFITNLALVLSLCSTVFQQLVDSYAIDDNTRQSANSISRQSSTPQVTQVLSGATAPDGRNHDTRRPIWNLAHMVNSIRELDYRLGKGANAVEVDVTFGRDGDPLYTFHGTPCDCWRHCNQQENFHDYLRYVREIAIDDSEGVGKNLSLLFLDLKLDYLDTKGKAHAGTELAKSIVSNLYLDSEASINTLVDNALTNDPLRIRTPIPKKTLRLMISVNHVTDLELVNNFLHFLEQNNSSHLMDRIGFDVGMNDDINQIESMWRRFGNTLNLWQGDGFTNCFSPFYNLERLTKAISKRDQSDGYPRKVYQWTIDRHDRMREALRLGVDAVMTNHPDRLLNILREPDMAHNYRLATCDDDPFKKIVVRASARNNELARHQRSANTSNGSYTAVVYDFFASVLNYFQEIPYLSSVSRLFGGGGSSKKRQKAAAAALTNVTVSKLNQPEYRVDARNDQQMNATTTSAMNVTSTKQVSISDSADQNETTTLASTSPSDSSTTTGFEQPPYEGPKWYTSLISNVLVSALKVFLPT